jgi:hypothetical protein
MRNKLRATTTTTQAIGSVIEIPKRQKSIYRPTMCRSFLMMKMTFLPIDYAALKSKTIYDSGPRQLHNIMYSLTCCIKHDKKTGDLDDTSSFFCLILFLIGIKRLLYRFDVRDLNSIYFFIPDNLHTYCLADSGANTLMRIVLPWQSWSSVG